MSSTSTASSGWFGTSLLARGLAADAAERLRDALAVAGPALADVAYESFAQAAIARLRGDQGWRRSTPEGTRTSRSGVTTRSWSASSRHSSPSTRSASVREGPDDGVYRSGRQAEALDAYRAARRAFVDELGIEPSPALQELERAILRQDHASTVPRRRWPGAAEAAERSVLVAVTDEARVDQLLAVAERLVQGPRRVLVLAGLVRTRPS